MKKCCSSEGLVFVEMGDDCGRTDLTHRPERLAKTVFKWQEDNSTESTFTEPCVKRKKRHTEQQKRDEMWLLSGRSTADITSERGTTGHKHPL